MSEWRVTLLPLDASAPVSVEHAVSGSLSWDLDQEVQGSATVAVSDMDIDWVRYRVRIFRDGEPVFTGFPTGSPEDFDDGTVDSSVSLMDLTGIPAGVTIPYMSGVPEGVNPILQAGVFLSAYELPVSLPAVEATLQASISWAANTNDLTRINDLLAAGGCGNLYATGLGTLAADLLVSIDRAPVADTYSATGTLYLPRWSRNRDVYRIPNRVTATSRTPGGDTPLDVTVDLPPESAYSAASTGRVVTKDMGEVDAADLTILTALATRELESSQAVAETRTITHEWVPAVRVGSVVEHQHHLRPTMRSHEVSQRIDMTPDGLCEATLEGVS